MNTPANSFHHVPSGGIVGVREDITDMIYDISPMDTIFTSSIGRGKAKQSLHEWQMDQLEAASSAAAPNAQIDGDDAVNTTPTLTQRLNNRCQIGSKTAQVTGRAEVAVKAGRDSEMNYQMARRMRALKRDVESEACQNGPISGGTTSAAPRAGGFETWIYTAVAGSRGAGGAATQGATPLTATQHQPTVATQPTDGTQRDITEAIFKGELQYRWNLGGASPIVIAGPVNKQKIDGFAGNATPMISADKEVRIATFSVYKSPFGNHKIVPSRWNRERSVLIVDPEYVALSYFRGYRTTNLAITGDSRRKQILVDWTLEMKNPDAQGIIADLNVT